MAVLNENQIDYLLQLKKTVPPLQEKTAMVMLRALRWSPEEVEHGIAFLELPPAPLDAKPPEPIKFTEPVDPASEPPKPVNIRQTPFPIGSPLLKSARHRAEVDIAKRRPIIFGFVVGFIIFCVGVILYMNFVGGEK